jgi:hypothetical protein
VEVNLRADFGIDLRYIDWLGALRYVVTMKRDGAVFVPDGNEVPDRELAMPALWKPFDH